MPLKAFRSVPKDIIEWAKYFTSLVITPDPGTITDATFADRDPASVIGRSAATVGPPADIVSAADRQVLIRRSGVLQFDGIAVADLPSSIATDYEVATAANSAQAAAEATAATALAAHVAASDPHSVYLTQTEGDARYEQSSQKNAASGYAGLNSSSRVTKGADITDDVVIDLATKGIVLKDTQGTPHYWRLTISNAGAIVITDLGTTKP